MPTLCPEPAALAAPWETESTAGPAGDTATPQTAPSSARGAQLLLPSSKPAQAAPSSTPKAQPSTSPSPGLTPSRPQATEDEALRAAVAEARQGGGSSANLFFVFNLQPAALATQCVRPMEVSNSSFSMHSMVQNIAQHYAQCGAVLSFFCPRLFLTSNLFFSS